jgi:hypothetical protein
MKTLLIYLEVPEQDPQFAILEGDYSRWNGICINSKPHEYAEEFTEYFFDVESGKIKIDLSFDVSVVESKMYDKVIIVTFLC